MSDNNKKMRWTSQILVGASISKDNLQNFMDRVPADAVFKFEPSESETIVTAEWFAAKR